MIKNLNWSSYKVPVFLVIFYCKLNFLNKNSKKYSSIMFHKKPSSESEMFCGQTDGAI